MFILLKGEVSRWQDIKYSIVRLLCYRCSIGFNIEMEQPKNLVGECPLVLEAEETRQATSHLRLFTARHADSFKKQTLPCRPQHCSMPDCL